MMKTNKSISGILSLFDLSHLSITEDGKRISVFSLALPALMQQVLLTVIGTVNTYMISGYAENAVGATAAASQLITLVNTLPGMVSVGAGVLINIELGRRDKERAAHYAGAATVFAAILGISALAKEEREHTAEFLLTHPVSRTRILTEKLFAVLTQVLILNLASALACFGCMALVEVDAKLSTMLLILLAHLILQLEIAAVTFGLSAFLRRGELGVGLGLVFVLYFLNILSNLTEDLDFLKYITPFSYTDGSYIVSEQSLEIKYLAVGIALFALGIVAAYGKYRRKDIA